MENFGFKSIYGSQFKQALAFCGRPWVPGEIQAIELPFLWVEAVVTAKFVRLGRLYGRPAAQFEIEVSGRMPYPAAEPARWPSGHGVGGPGP